jgi:hypothetical protein
MPPIRILRADRLFQARDVNAGKGRQRLRDDVADLVMLVVYEPEEREYRTAYNLAMTGSGGKATHFKTHKSA